MHDHPSTPKQPVMVRLPRAFAAEVRRIAEKESESQATVLRRLLRVGLATERQTAGMAR